MFSPFSLAYDIPSIKEKADGGDPKAQYIYALARELGRGVHRNNDVALEYYEKSAAQGFAKAQYTLGMIYFYDGRGLEDFQRGVEFLEKASRQGHVGAKYTLSVIYLEGVNGIPQDKDTGMKLLKEAVSKTNAEALFYYGDRLIEGEGVRKNTKKGISLLESAANKQANINSMYELAVLNYEGRLIAQNIEMALKYLRRAAKLRDTDSRHLLAVLLMEGFDKSLSPSEAFKEARKNLELALIANPPDLIDDIRFRLAIVYSRSSFNANYPKALSYLNPLADKGHIGAMALRGELFFRGKGFKKDYENALVDLVPAAEQKEPRALFVYGLMLIKGLAVEKNPELGIQHLKESASLGYTEAQLKLGEDYFRGTAYLTQDYKEAKIYLEMAAEKKEVKAHYLLGLIHLKGLGVEKNLEVALDYFREGAKQKHSRSQYYFASLLMDKVDKSLSQAEAFKGARENLELALKAKHPEIMDDIHFRLALIHSKPDFSGNYPLALSYLNPLANKGHIGAMALRGELIFKGRGFNQSYKKALVDLKPAAEQKEPRALYILGRMHLNGFGVEKNPELGTQLLKESASLGYARAQLRLGENYFTGVPYLAQDYKEAKIYLEMAAEKGEAKAHHLLGVMHLNGLGVEKNLELAFEYFRFGIRNGHVYSRYYFASLLMQGVNKSFTQAEAYLDARILLKLVIKTMPYHKESHYLLAKIYSSGIGRKDGPDFEKARNHVSVAIKQGHIEALTLRAEMRLQGQGFDQSFSEAVKDLTLAVEKNEPRALYILGLMHLEGKGVKQDKAQALEFLKRSASLGYAPAQAQVEKMELPEMINQNPKQAFKTLESKKEEKSPEELLLLGRMHLEGRGTSQNVPLALELLESSKLPEAQYLIGRTLVFGDGVTKNIPRGIEILEKISPEHAPSEALYLLARLYHWKTGLGKTRQDILDLLEKATEKEKPSADALFMRAVLLVNGGQGKDMDLVKNLLKQATKLGHGQAKDFLEELLSGKKDIAKNYTQFFKLDGLKERAAYSWLKKVSKEEVLKLIKSGKRNLSNLNLSGMNLSNLNLEKINFSGSNLDGVNFSNSPLKESNFKGATLIGANFSGADPLLAKFEGANISYAYLEKAIVSRPAFQGALYNGEKVRYLINADSKLALYVETTKGSWEVDHEGFRARYLEKLKKQRLASSYQAKQKCIDSIRDGLDSK